MLFRSACQVQSPVVEWAQIEAGTSVITETILNSVIHCGGTVYVMSGRGLIADSRIQTGDSILCLRIGNLAGGRNQFSVGYPPNIPESWKQMKEELADVQATLDKLWAHITGLRRKSFRMTEEEKALLEQLVVQRDLYTEKRETLAADLKTASMALSKRTKGRIRCENLYPVLDVQIGRLSKEIISAEEKCNIHAEDNQILLK